MNSQLLTLASGPTRYQPFYLPRLRMNGNFM